MEYPGTRFTRPWRLAFLSLFIIAFLIISPALVLYSSGYRYDFKNGIIQETGAISIDIMPKNASAYLNDAKLKSKVPIRLKNLARGKYKIKLTADGYYDWEKEVVVENKQTVYIKEIKLIKKSEAQKISDNNVKIISLSKNDEYLIYQTHDNPSLFWLRNINSDTEMQFVTGTLNKSYQINWSNKNNNYATIVSDDLGEIYVINASDPTKHWNLSKLEKNVITKVQWNNTTQPELFYSTKNQLMVINPATKQKSLIGKNIFFDWFVDGGQIWTLQNNTSTDQINIVKDTFGFSKIINQVNKLPNVDNKYLNWQIVKTMDNQVLLKKSEISEMTLVDQEKHFTFFGDEMLSSNFNNWWIMWTPWEITTYSQGEEPFLLNRSGEQLKKVLVLDEFNTLGLIWADKMTALFPYYFVSHNLLNFKINDAVANTSKRELYFGANLNNQNGLWKIQY